MFHNQDMLDVWMLYVSIPGQREIIEHRWTKREVIDIRDEMLAFGDARPEQCYIQKVTKPIMVIHE